MFLEGRVWQDPDDAKFWLIEIPILNLMTQGKSKKDAFKMIKDATSLLIKDLPMEISNGFTLKIEEFGEITFGLSCSIPFLLVAIIVRRQREGSGIPQRRSKKDGKALFYTDKIESGRSSCSMIRFIEILQMYNPKQKLVLTVR